MPWEQSLWSGERGCQVFDARVRLVCGANKELETADTEPDEQNRQTLVAPLLSACVACVHSEVESPFCVCVSGGCCVCDKRI